MLFLKWFSVLLWDTSHVAAGLYSCQIIVYNGLATTPVDFLINVVNASRYLYVAYYIVGRDLFLLGVGWEFSHNFPFTSRCLCFNTITYMISVYALVHPNVLAIVNYCVSRAMTVFVLTAMVCLTLLQPIVLPLKTLVAVVIRCQIYVDIPLCIVYMWM